MQTRLGARCTLSAALQPADINAGRASCHEDVCVWTSSAECRKHVLVEVVYIPQINGFGEPMLEDEARIIVDFCVERLLGPEAQAFQSMGYWACPREELEKDDLHRTTWSFVKWCRV